MKEYYSPEAYNQRKNYHSERHLIDLMFIFRFLLPEWAVPEPKRNKLKVIKSFWHEIKAKRIKLIILLNFAVVLHHNTTFLYRVRSELTLGISAVV